MASTPPEAPEHLTVPDVAAGVEEVRERSGDEEVAHGREDGLHQRVLRAIAAGAPDAPALAAEALKTTEIEFDRWYA